MPAVLRVRRAHRARPALRLAPSKPTAYPQGLCPGNEDESSSRRTAKRAMTTRSSTPTRPESCWWGRRSSPSGLAGHVSCRRLRHGGRRGGVAPRGAHPRIRPGNLDQPRASSHLQVAAAQGRDRQLIGKRSGGRADARSLSLYFKGRQSEVELALGRGRRSTTSVRRSRNGSPNEADRALGRGRKGMD